MAEPYFIWNNMNSTSKNLWLSQYPDDVRAAERQSVITVPGRPGALTIKEGDSVYDPVKLACRVQCKRSENSDVLSNWLCGSGLVVFGNQPTRARMAKITNEVRFVRISNDLKEASVIFECEPFKRAYPAESDITLTASTTELNNVGNVPAQPVIKINGSGDIVLTVNGNEFEVKDVTAQAILDCSARIATEAGESILTQTSGIFPVLNVGNNSVSWEGAVSSVVITPNWRYR